MPYIIRDKEGGVIGLSEQGQENGDEQLPLSHPDVRAFLENAREQLSSSDVEIIRVIEDLVDVLIQKKVILLTDLPQAAQKKLSKRQSMRSDLHVLGDLMVDEDDIL